MSFSDLFEKILFYILFEFENRELFNVNWIFILY